MKVYIVTDADMNYWKPDGTAPPSKNLGVFTSERAANAFGQTFPHPFTVETWNVADEDARP